MTTVSNIGAPKTSQEATIDDCFEHWSLKASPEAKNDDSFTLWTQKPPKLRGEKREGEKGGRREGEGTCFKMVLHLHLGNCKTLKEQPICTICKNNEAAKPPI